MGRRHLWRWTASLIVLALCCGAGLLAAKALVGNKKGYRLVLQVSAGDLLLRDLQRVRDRAIVSLKENRSPSANVQLEGGGVIVQGLPDDSVREIALAFPGYRMTAQKNAVSFRPESGYSELVTRQGVERTRRIIESRLRLLGFPDSWGRLRQLEGDRVEVRLPVSNSLDIERTKRLLSTPGRLEQRLKAENDPGGPLGCPTREVALANLNGRIPPGTELLPEVEKRRRTLSPAPDSIAGGSAFEAVKPWHLLETRIYVDGEEIVDARSSVNPITKANEILFVLSRKGTHDFETLTGIAARENRLISMVMDGVIIANLACRDKISGGKVCITGKYTKSEAEDFALKLKSGAFPARLTIAEEGEDSIPYDRRREWPGIAAGLGLMILAIGAVALIWSR